MAYSVTTYKSERELSVALTATVTICKSESTLEEVITNATSLFKVIGKGMYFVVIDNPLVVNVSLDVVDHGNYFTVILETV